MTHGRSVAGLRAGLLLAIVLMLSLFAGVARGEPGARSRSVLVLQSHGPASQHSYGQAMGVRDVIVERYGNKVSLHDEYMQLGARNDDAYRAMYCDFLKRKYGDRVLNGVVLIDSGAVAFWEEHGADIAGGVPVVFSGLVEPRSEAQRRAMPMTGVMERIDVAGTLEFLRQCMPQRNRIVIITSAVGFGPMLRSRAEDAIAASPGIDALYLSMPTENDLLALVEREPERTAVLFVSGWAVDSSGQAVHPCHTLDLKSKVPSFACYESDVHFGGIGGSVARPRLMGRAAGEMLVRVLEGEDPASIPVNEDGVTGPVASWSLCEKWGLNRASLPPGTAMVQVPSSWIERHKRLLITSAAVACVALMSASWLITVLVMRSNRWRRRAESALRESEQMFRAMFESSLDGMAINSPDLKWIAVNDELCRMFRCDRATLDGHSWLDLTPPEVLSVCQPKLEQVIRGELESYMLDKEFQRPDGSRFAARVSVAGLRGRNGLVERVMVLMTDVSDMKQAELQRERAIVELRESRDSIESLLAAASRLQSATSEQQVLQETVDAITSTGWSMALAALYTPEWGRKHLAHSGLSATDAELVASTPPSPRQARALFAPEKGKYRVSRSYFIPHTESCELDITRAHGRVGADKPDGRAWMLEDVAYIPLLGGGGEVIGAISIDGPSSGLRPDEATFRYLEFFADLAARRIEHLRLDAEQQRARLAIARSEERLRLMAENLGECFWLMDFRSGRMEYISPAFESIWGRSASDVDPTGRFDRWVHPDDFERFRVMSEARLSDTLQGPAELEYRILTGDGRVRWVHSRSRPVRDETGQLMYLVGAVDDITDRKTAEEALRESEERYRSIVEDQTELIVRFRRDGTLTFVNGAFARFFGKRPEALIGRVFRPTVHEADRGAVAAYFDEVSSERPVGSFECRYVLDSGEVRWTRWTHRALFDDAGEIVEYQGVGSDVTAEVQSEAARRESEGHLASIAESLPGMVYRAVISPDGTVRYPFQSSRAPEIYGQMPVAKKTIDQIGEYCPPEDGERLRAHIRDSLETLEPCDIQYRVISKDGTLHWVHGLARARRLPDGDTQYDGIVLDITKQKLAEQALSQSEQRLKAVAENVPGMMFRLLVTTRQTVCLPFISAGWSQFYDGSTLIEKPIERLGETFHPDDQARMIEAVKRCVDTLQTLDIQVRVNAPDGSQKWLHLRATPVRQDDGSTAFDGIGLDITAQKESELALKENQERLEAITRNLPGIVYRHVITKDMMVHYMYLSEGRQGVIPSGAIESKPFSRLGEFLPAEERRRLHAETLRCIETLEPFDLQLRNRSSEGEDRWVHFAASVTRLPNGDTVFDGVGLDVTDQKRSELALQESEKRYYTLFDSNPLPVIVFHANSLQVLDVNAAAEAQYGYTREEFSQLTMCDIVALEDAQGRCGAEFAAEIHAQSAPTGVRHCRRDGTVFDVTVRSHAVRLGSLGVRVAIMQDVTEIRRAEAARRESEERFRQIAECIREVFWLTSADEPRALYVSPAFEQVWGFKPDALYASLDALHASVHPEDRERFRAAAIGRGEVNEIEYRIVRPDGTVRWIHDRAFPVLNERGEMYRVAGIAEDITERKLAEQTIANGRAQLEAFVAHTPAAVAMFDREMQYLQTSKRWLDDYGLGEQSVIGRSYYEVFPETPDQWKDIHRRCLAGEVAQCSEDRFVRANGSEQWLRWEVRPWYTDEGALGGILMLTEDITERRAAEASLRKFAETQRLLLRELDHRVKNAMAGLLAMIDISMPSYASKEEFASAVRRRVRAMAEVHSMLSESRWAPVDLRLLAMSLAPPDAPGRVELVGPSVCVPPRQATALGMIIQELMSNATKYGALRQQGGVVRVEWKVMGRGPEGGCMVHLAWRERCPQACVIEGKPGLGTSLVRGFARSELRGSVAMRFSPHGVEHEFSLTFDESIEPDSTPKLAAA